MLSVPDETLLRFAGLDAFVMVRYLRMCIRMCLLPAVLGTALLLPVYAQGDEWKKESSLGDDDDTKNQQIFNKFTLLNVIYQSDITSGDGEAQGTSGPLWLVAVVVAYIYFIQVAWSLGHLATWSLGHLGTWSLGHLSLGRSVTRSLGHLVTGSLGR